MDRKPNILIVHNYYQIPGGEDTVVHNEKELLEEYGHKVILYTRSNIELKDILWWQKLLLPFSTIYNPRTSRDIKRIIREEHIDLVHVHNTLNLISPAIYYAARKMKKPVIQTIHNYRLLCPAATFYRGNQICEECVYKGLHTAVKYRCYRKSTIQTLACVISMHVHRTLGIYKKISYICLTEFNKNILLKQKQICDSQIFVKPNFSAVKNEMIITSNREKAVLYAGRIEQIKGIDVLLQTWKELGEAAPILYLCGAGTEENWCKEYIEQNNMKSVIFLGQKEHQEIMQYMTRVKALVLPTKWYEGFPMTIVEAYSVGTPVIGPDMGNVGNLIVQNVTGIKYQKSLFDAVIEAMSTEWDNLKIAEYCEEQYGLEKNYLELSKIYSEVMK